MRWNQAEGREIEETKPEAMRFSSAVDMAEILGGCGIPAPE